MRNDTQLTSKKPLNEAVILLDVVIIGIIFRTGK